MGDLNTTVWVRNPDTNESESFGPGDELPKWALDQIGDHAFEDGKKPAAKRAASKSD